MPEIKSIAVILDEMEEQARSVVISDVPQAKKLRGEGLGVQFLPRIIESLYRRYFTQPIPPAVMRGKVAGKVIAELRDMLPREKIDPTTWVTAQFDCVRSDLVKQAPNPFALLNLLRGEDARRRYNAFVLQANIRLHHASSRSFESNTLYARFIDTVSRDEDDVGDVFTFWRRSGDPRSWDDAVRIVGPSEDWLAVRTTKNPVRRTQFETQFGKKRVTLAVQIAQLRAANNVAALLKASLPYRTGMEGQFDWTTFADYLASEFPCRKTTEAAPGAVVFGEDLLSVVLSDEEKDA